MEFEARQSGSRVWMINFYILPSFLLVAQGTKLDRIREKKVFHS